MATADMLQQQYLPPALHLINLNPHLEAPLSMGPTYVSRGGPSGLPWSGSGADTLGHNHKTEIHAQDDAAVGMRDVDYHRQHEMTFGVSSFGAQGTNAHALVSSMYPVARPAGSPAPSSDMETQPEDSKIGADATVSNSGIVQDNGVRDVPLHMSRYWVHPTIQRLMSRAVIHHSRATGPRLVLEGKLDVPGVSYLWDGPSFLTTASDPANRVVMVTAASLALPAAASAAALLYTNVSEHQALLSLQNVVMAKPSVLPGKPGAPGNACPALHVTISQAGIMHVKMGMQQMLRGQICSVSVTGSSSELHASSKTHVQYDAVARIPSEDDNTALSEAFNPGGNAARSVLAGFVRQKVLQFTAGNVAHGRYVTCVRSGNAAEPSFPGYDSEGYTSCQPQIMDTVVQLAALQTSHSDVDSGGNAAAAQVYLSSTAFASTVLQPLPSPDADNPSLTNISSTDVGVVVSIDAHMERAVEESSDDRNPAGTRLLRTTCVINNNPSANSSSCFSMIDSVIAPMDAGLTDIARAAAAARADLNAGNAHDPAHEDDPTAKATPTARHPLLDMPPEERLEVLQIQVMSEVRSLIGRIVHPDEPLIAAGVDSRSGMELRSTISHSVGLSLPPTLLYDYQTVTDIVTFVNAQVEKQGQEGGNAGPGDAAGHSGNHSDGGTDDDEGEEEEEEWEVLPATEQGVARRVRRQRNKRSAKGRVEGAVEEEDSKPSELLKTLRPPVAPRPLFLAAPGVANAQSAYFTFSSYLRWSDQPIYVLDKDNDLNIAQ